MARPKRSQPRRNLRGQPTLEIVEQPQPPPSSSGEAGASAEIYGRLKEGVHVAGYSFERAFGHLEWLLEDGRWKLGHRYTDVNAFLASIKLDQFRIVAEQRKRLAQRIKELQPAASQRAIARVVGASKSAINRDIVPSGT